jgi:hypothetical protein
MANLSSRLNNCKIFSKLDLQKGFLQVPVREEDIPKTAIITLLAYSSLHACHLVSKTPA